MTPIALYLTEVNRDGYYHLFASVVTDGPEGIRNCEWTRGGNRESAEGIFVDDLEVYSQGQNESRRCDDGSPNLYAWEVHFKPYSVDDRRAKHMAETFRTLDRKMAKLAEQFGRPVTYGQYLGRVALALGCATFIFPTGPSSSSYAERSHRRYNLQDGIAQADFLVHRWAEGKKAA